MGGVKAVEREKASHDRHAFAGASDFSEIEREVRGSASGKKVHRKEFSAAKQAIHYGRV